MRPTLLALVLLALGCAVDPVRACTPGASVPCACLGGGTGAQVCAASGDGYGACVCADAGPGTPDASTAPDVVAVADTPAIDAADVPAADAGPSASDATRGDAAACAACPEAPNAVTTCTDGVCGWTCRPGFADCDGNAGNGCEVDHRTDPVHCSACGRACPAAPAGMVATCIDGVCGAGPLMCPAGRANCDGDVANGCEVETARGVAGAPREVDHCGVCGRTCRFANAPAQCLAGVCVAGACEEPFRDCDGDRANGCEVNTNTSTTHCGRCGGFCFFANASPACVGGECRMANCNTGWCDRNRDARDGCEYRGACPP